MGDEHPDTQLVAALDRACPCTVRLTDERVLRVLDIAWGYDIGDDHAHVTTNCSPGEPGAPLDVFFTCEVEAVTESTGEEVPAALLRPEGSCNCCY